MRVLVAMSGGVDSSVAAALVRDAGHQAVGATMKLWGGPSDQGCCSVGDVEDARRVCQQLGLDHHVFNFSEEFERRVVEPYVEGHAAGLTPNPCIECNRHLKFDRFLDRALSLGFDAVATGHHARVKDTPSGPVLRRGADPAKDQSYVLHMLSAAQLARTQLPVGSMTKAEVRDRAERLGLRTAAKPDSQDVCFISKSGGRQQFLGSRIVLHPGRVLDENGQEIGTVPAVELVTVGQRKGIGPAVGSRYAVDVDIEGRTVRVGPPERLMVDEVWIPSPAWVHGPPGEGDRVEVQTSAHGAAVPGRWEAGRVVFDQPIRRVAPGQSAVLYRGDTVVGGGPVGGENGAAGQSVSSRGGLDGR